MQERKKNMGFHEPLYENQVLEREKYYMGKHFNVKQCVTILVF